MSDESKTFERKLDIDFLHYLSLTKTLYTNLTDDVHKQFCEIWLAYLFGKTCNSLSEKCDRNIYISRLLLQMQSGRLNANFLEPPPNGPLPCAFTAFGLPTEVEGLKGIEDMGYQVDSSFGIGSGDFCESSRDGRTYLATRHLPQGIMAFMAVTNNEGEPAWVPQTCPASLNQDSERRRPEQLTTGYRTVLRDTVELPLTVLRRSPEERDKVLEWMDKIINDCSKWLQGEDPHNMELEELFQTLFEEYKKDPENSELLKHPRTVRNILFRDIRNHMYERRAEVSKREMILDQLESDQYERNMQIPVSDVWMRCLSKQLHPNTISTLKAHYSDSILSRFIDFVFNERMAIVIEGEKRAKQKISKLRETILEESKAELQKLKKAQDEYKEYYAIYKDIEAKLGELEAEFREICGLTVAPADMQNAEKCKQDRESLIRRGKENLDREMKTLSELRAKMGDIKATCGKANEKMKEETEILNCKRYQLHLKSQELTQEINELNQKRQEIRCRIQARSGN